MYNALIVKARLSPHPNADRLLLCNALNYQVIVGNDTKEGELLVFFEQGGQISENFAITNNLLRSQKLGGLFDDNRRVKAVKLRGIKSEGFAVPLSYLEKMSGGDISSLKEGDELSAWNGVELCRKYESPQTKAARGANKQGAVRIKLANFPEHAETSNFRREGRYIPTGSILYISEKLHGTSARIGNCLVTVPRLQGLQKFDSKWAKRAKGVLNNLLNKILGVKRDYRIIHGTRRVMIGEAPRDTGGFHGSDAFRFFCTAFIRPTKDEIIYGEIVGWDDRGNSIMPAHSTNELPDLKKQYGEQFVYSYGQAPGSCKFYIYRITRVNQDGNEIDLSWPQVKRRADELGVDVVPYFAGPFVYDGDSESAFKVVDIQVNGLSGNEVLPSTLCQTHIREGVVVRAETPDGRTAFYKHKSFAFGILEGCAAEKGAVDTEDVQKEEEGEVGADQAQQQERKDEEGQCK